MIVENTDNGDLDFNDPDYDLLKTGIVIFPENIDDVERLKEFLEIL